jgi:hypothetical protein
MNLAETMTAIEQDQFAAEMSLAAGTKTFLRMVREHNLFQQLASFAKTNSADIVARMEAIADAKIDERYENPFDTALSAYMIALSDAAGLEVTSKAAQAVLRTPKCWWSSGIAREALLKTVASGSIVAAQNPRDRLYVRLDDWLTAPPSSRRGSTTISELMQAVSARQPTGKENTGEFPVRDKGQNSDTASKRRRRKLSSQPHTIAARTRMRA